VTFEGHFGCNKYPASCNSVEQHQPVWVLSRHEYVCVAIDIQLCKSEIYNSLYNIITHNINRECNILAEKEKKIESSSGPLTFDPARILIDLTNNKPVCQQYR